MTSHALSISVVTPVYNAETWLVQMLESVALQEGVTVEHLVILDGPTDSSQETAEAFAANNPHVRLIYQPNMGEVSAVNIGLKRASFEYITVLNADDLIDAGALANMCQALHDDPAIVCVYPQWRTIDASGATQEVFKPPTFSRKFMYATMNCLPGPGAVFRRSAMEQTGAHRRSRYRLVSDFDFWLQLLDAGDFKGDPVVRASWRLHATNQGSTSGFLTYPQEMVQLAVEYLGHPRNPPIPLLWRAKGLTRVVVPLVMRRREAASENVGRCALAFDFARQVAQLTWTRQISIGVATTLFFYAVWAVVTNNARSSFITHAS